MQNEEGQSMDLYIPGNGNISLHLFYLNTLISFCWNSATNRLITSKDHLSVQINIGHLDANGHYTGQFSTFALYGFVPAQIIVLASLFILTRINFGFEVFRLFF
uniref:Uncharacterized protein n=1 Tax=Manihot esculenta TaxID=3983 RepID=A0A2C9UH90_MANES